MVQPSAYTPARVDVPCESTEVTFELRTTFDKMSCWLNRSHVYHSRRRGKIRGLDKEFQTHDVIRRTDREQREGHLLGSSYRPVGSVLAKRAGCGRVGEDALDTTQEEPKYSLAEARQRLEALDARRTSAHGFIADFVDEGPYHTPVLSTCPLHTNSGCGKERRVFDWSMVTCQGSTRSELP